MQEIISTFLVQNKQCTLPSIGTFKVERRSAELDVAARSMLPPVDEILFTEKEEGNNNLLINYIISKRGITQDEAESLLNQFCADTADNLRKGQKIFFNSFGTLEINQENKLTFTPSASSFLLQPISANAVIHAHPDHELLVGNRETTSIAMTEYLNDRGIIKTTNWRMWALILGLLAVSILVYFYSTHTFKMDGVGNSTSF